jgi:SNF2 family DNA or RNA helicase
MRSLKDLRPYQQRIATALYENDEELCVLRPGGGKTVAALTAIVDLLRDKVIRHAIVIAPKRVACVVWPDEIEAWAHTNKLRYSILNGSPHDRELLLRSWGLHDVILIGLDLVPWLFEQLDQLPANHMAWDLLVLDEASRLRKPSGVRAKVLAKHAHRFRMIWGLSGTLRPSGPLDLFMPSRIVTRGKLWGRSYAKWQREHFYPTDYMQYDWKPLPGAEEKLNRELAPLTVMVAEGEMPTVTPTIVFDRVTLPPEARHKYESMRRRLMAQVKDKSVLAVSAAVATGKLAQMANGFIYPNYDESERPDPASMRIHDAKREWLVDLIENAIGNTLIIYDYKADLEMLRFEIERDGQIFRHLGAGVTDKQAADNIADWNAGKLKFMGLHPASGGHGLNLQHGGADMAWISPCWSPEYWEQTIARIARPGQTRPVVVRVCIANDTVDALKVNRVHHKMSAQDAFEAWLRGWHADRAA